MSDSVNRSSAATHGNNPAQSFRDELVRESDRNPVALAFLNEAIDTSGVPRKQLAATVEKTEGTFSKMTTTGPNAQAFGLDSFERLPLRIQVAWLKRYGRQIGLEVHELSALAVADAIAERFDELSRFIRMFQIGKKHMAHGPTDQRYLGVERRRA